MPFSLFILLFGIISLNIYLVLFGAILLLIKYFSDVLDEHKEKMISQKRFNNELRESGRLN